MWVRGTKKLESKKKITIDPKNPTTIFSETMSLITKFQPDPANPSQYKRKRCYLQLMAMSKGQLKPVGILPFNLAEFLNISPNSTIKLTFAKCFDPNAAIFLTASKQEIEQTEGNFETESNATMETVSDTFSEYGNRDFNLERKVAKPNTASFATADGTTPSSYIESDTRSASFVSSQTNEKTEKHVRAESKIEIDKDKLQIQKLTNEVEHYKNLLGEKTEKIAEIETSQKDNSEKIEKLQGLLEEKENLVNVLRQEVKQKQEEFDTSQQAQHTEKHKLKMKIDYLTNKCFQLNCKLDKKDFKPGEKAEKEDVSMLVDIIEKKQQEYCNTEKNQLQDPTDFLFNLFAQYENMQNSIRKLSEQNNQLKQDLVETKVNWAESEGQKEKLEITVNSMKNQMQRMSVSSSQRGSQTSAGSPSKPVLNKDNSTRSFSSYIPSISFWSRGQGA